MPIYDYRCTACGLLVEVVHGIHESGPATCGACGGAMRKALSTPAIHFKGSGWAKKDAAASARKAKPAADPAASTASSEPASDKGSDDSAKAAGNTKSATPASDSAPGKATTTSSAAKAD